jgi:DNA-binding response OmpR family regulator
MINVLIVDDNSEKFGFIIKVLAEDAFVPNENIEIALAADDAGTKLSKKHYDLLVLAP